MNNNHKGSYVDKNSIDVKKKDGKIDVQETIKANPKKIPTTTQLRLLLSNSVVIKNKIEMDKNEHLKSGKSIKDYKLSQDIKDDIDYLLIRHIYQCGRDNDNKLKNFDEAFDISDKIKKIGYSNDEFKKYYRYLEEIVAYVKYYVG